MAVGFLAELGCAGVVVRLGWLGGFERQEEWILMPKFAVTLEPSDPWATPEGCTVIVEADRWDAQDGALLFYGNDPSNVYTVLVAYAPGTWKRVERVNE